MKVGGLGKHCFLPNQNRTKLAEDWGFQNNALKKIIIFRLWLTREANQSFLTIDVGEQSTNQIRQGERIDQLDYGDFVGESSKNMSERFQVPNSNACAHVLKLFLQNR